ncbi:MAG TPA: DsbE family thiol:disulfide interchange protein [Steroidobacteraceae bacterium]|jgi:cytochrome c biogenesis protein CcmG/thiol:disulfide interchange protein DsbE|nr:DsbE family thiol:disulfide interchange protein [Steroidobacteraceae bacterium]
MINRFVIPMVAFVLLAVVLAVGIKHSPEKGVIASPLIGKPAPQFSLPSLSDPTHTVSSAALRGQWYLLNVWGSWCGTCRDEHQMLLDVRRSGRVRLIGLDWRDDDSQARGYLQQLGDPYEFVAADRDGRTAIDWGVYAAPESFLVNPAGIVVYKCMGELTPDIWEKEILSRLPKAQAAGS